MTRKRSVSGPYECAMTGYECATTSYECATTSYPSTSMALVNTFMAVMNALTALMKAFTAAVVPSTALVNVLTAPKKAFMALSKGTIFSRRSGACAPSMLFRRLFSESGGRAERRGDLVLRLFPSAPQSSA